MWHSWTKPERRVWQDGEMHGASTVALCRMYPELRPVWGFVAVVSGPAWKRYAARCLAAAPWLAKRLLGLLTALLEETPWRSWLRELGSRLHAVRYSTAVLAGARRKAGSWPERAKRFGPRLPVLLYHHVGSPTPFTEDYRLTVRPAAFDQHMGWIRRLGYTPITPSQWLAWREAGPPIPDKPVLLSFDDAYADVAEHALPILKRHGFNAAVFVITGLSRESRRWEDLPVMTLDQVRYWARQGVEIGAHSRTHPDLTTVDAAALQSEVAGAKQDLVESGITAVCFAYPYGCYDHQVRTAVADEYQIAFTTDKGVNDLRTDPMLMRRTIVHPSDTLVDFALRLRFGWSPRDWLDQHFRKWLSKGLRAGPKLRNFVRKMRDFGGA